MLNIYRASAGSGKTYRLTKDYIELLFDPRSNHRRILAVTFTNKATDEMKSRILKELHLLAQGQLSGYRNDLMAKFKLSEEAVNAKARKLLLNILHDYSSFSISTIDKFFQQVIRAFAREMGLHGGYTLELDSDAILQQSVDNLFHDLSKTENQQLLSWLTRFAEERIEQSENWNPRRSIEALGYEVFKENYQNKAANIHEKLHDREFLKNYQESLRAIAKIFEENVKGAVNKALVAIEQHGLTHDDFAYKQTKSLEKIAEGKYEVPQRIRNYLLDVANCYTKKTPDSIKQSIEAAYYGGLQIALDELIHLIDVDIILYNSASIVLKHLNTLGILTDLSVHIKAVADEQNALLISDTNMLLHRIIDQSDAPFVYEKTGVNVQHYMIDEFQDTSALQWQNFRPLLDNSLAAQYFNLVVGDVKQSIYRWRNSDWKLLDSEINKSFRPDLINEEVLDTNYRSDRAIVDFNNEFFRRAASLMQDKLNFSMGNISEIYPELASLQSRIVHAYEQLYQKKKSNADEGYVEFRFISEEESDEKWMDLALQQLPTLLEELQDRGYRPSDIAFLVRTNAEEKLLIQHLLSYKASDLARNGYCYDVLGNEGLMLNSSSAVRFILGLMRLMLNPHDDIQRSIVNVEYARAMQQQNKNWATNDSATDSKKLLLSAHESRFVEQLQQSSLFEMTEQIIATFEMGKWANEAVFLQAFQDVVFKFINNKGTDLYSFLRWWDKVGDKQAIATPESTASFRAMTVHKAKGLDFNVMIMPFCDWDMEKTKGNQKQILWCEPQFPPFNQLPVLPVEYGRALGQSVFAANYYDEQMHQFIDNLNVAYVAFTRPRHEMYCFMPQTKKPVEGIEKISKISHLLNFCCNNIAETMGDVDLTAAYNAEESVFYLGTKKTSIQNNTAEETPPAFDNYPSVPNNARLKLRHKHINFLAEDKLLGNDKQKFGSLMHEVLRRIRYKTEQAEVIAALHREGFLSTTEIDQIEASLQSFWQLSGVEQWFTPDWKVLNENSILTPDGSHYRPDRVILRDKKAIVIDYKFGAIEEKEHRDQVLHYRNLLLSMGYDAQAWLCYPALAKVFEVQD